MRSWFIWWRHQGWMSREGLSSLRSESQVHCVGFFLPIPGHSTTKVCCCYAFQFRGYHMSSSLPWNNQKMPLYCDASEFIEGSFACICRQARKHFYLRANPRKLGFALLFAYFFYHYRSFLQCHPRNCNCDEIPDTFLNWSILKKEGMEYKSLFCLDASQICNVGIDMHFYLK